MSRIIHETTSVSISWFLLNQLTADNIIRFAGLKNIFCVSHSRIYFCKNMFTLTFLIFNIWTPTLGGSVLWIRFCSFARRSFRNPRSQKKLISFYWFFCENLKIIKFNNWRSLIFGKISWWVKKAQKWPEIEGDWGGLEGVTKIWSIHLYFFIYIWKY